jgi:hypothetical protein
MKEHLCPVEKALITYEGSCNWCGESEGSMTQDELIKRLETTCFGLDPIDPLRLLVDDVIAALAQPKQDGDCKKCKDGCPACDARKLQNDLL